VSSISIDVDRRRPARFALVFQAWQRWSQEKEGRRGLGAISSTLNYPSSSPPSFLLQRRRSLRDVFLQTHPNVHNLIALALWTVRCSDKTHRRTLCSQTNRREGGRDVELSLALSLLFPFSGRPSRRVSASLCCMCVHPVPSITGPDSCTAGISEGDSAQQTSLSNSTKLTNTMSVPSCRCLLPFQPLLLPLPKEH